jgi:tetratricopeptide (TPR) repeat protein
MALLPIFSRPSKNVTIGKSCEITHSSSMVSTLLKEYNVFVQNENSAMNNLFNLGALLSTSLALFLVLVGNAFFSNNNLSTNVDLESILRLIDEGEFSGAIDQLHVELDNDHDNPEILSLIGLSHRRLLNYEDALIFYQSALQVEPEHPGANQHLGELFIETGQLDKAQKQLELLESLNLFASSEYAELKESIEQNRHQTGSA